MLDGLTGEAQDETKPAPRPVAASLGGGGGGADDEPKTFDEALYAGIGEAVPALTPTRTLTPALTLTPTLTLTRGRG